jgi:hypothetical protein
MNDDTSARVFRAPYHQGVSTRCHEADVGRRGRVTRRAPYTRSDADDGKVIGRTETSLLSEIADGSEADQPGLFVHMVPP